MEYAEGGDLKNTIQKYSNENSYIKEDLVRNNFKFRYGNGWCKFSQLLNTYIIRKLYTGISNLVIYFLIRKIM
jgi:hypothetical protein